MGIRGGTEILPGVRVLLGGVKYFVGSFKKKLEKINVAFTDKVRKTSMSDIFIFFPFFDQKTRVFRAERKFCRG